MSTESDIDTAQRNVDELEKLMHDDVYKFLRIKMHDETDADEIVRLNLLLEIRREQVKNR
jgi:hypothetical protein